MANTSIFTRYLLVTFFLCSFLSLHLAAQNVTPEDTEDESYTREFVWGITKNTNSGLIGGLNVKFSRRIGEGLYRSLGLEVVNVKHPLETRYPSITGGSFIWGKSHYLYSLRGSYGYEKRITKKAPQYGVQLNALVSGGPTIGIIAPYYIEYSNSRNGFTSTVPYDPAVHFAQSGRIYGPGRPLEGITESEITVGLHLRAGLSLEFGTFKSAVSGVEIGLMLEAFPQEVVLLPNAANRAIFPSAYITIFHGSRR